MDEVDCTYSACCAKYPKDCPTDGKHGDKTQDYSCLSFPGCPHCGGNLRRAKRPWRGKCSLYCEKHGRVFPACVHCGEYHKELERFSI